jgi:hypothetical protein
VAPKDQILQRFKQHRQRKLLTVKLPIDPAIGVEDGGLCDVGKAACRLAIGKAKLGQQSLGRGGVGAGNEPAVDIKQTMGSGESRQLARTIPARIETERQHVEPARSQHTVRLGYRIAQMVGHDRADGRATRVNQRHDQWLAAQIVQRQGPATVISQNVVAGRIANRGLAFLERNLGVELFGGDTGQRDKERQHTKAKRFQNAHATDRSAMTPIPMRAN